MPAPGATATVTKPITAAAAEPAPAVVPPIVSSGAPAVGGGSGGAVDGGGTGQQPGPGVTTAGPTPGRPSPTRTRSPRPLPDPTPRVPTTAAVPTPPVVPIGPTPPVVPIVPTTPAVPLPTTISPAPTSAAPPTAPPAAPQRPVVTAGVSTLTLTWAPPADAGTPIASYTVTCSTAGVAAQKVDAATPTATFSSLKPGTAYTFAITATDTAARTGPATPATGKTLAAPGPSAPQGVSADGGQNAVTLHWSAPAQSVLPVDHYTITQDGGGSRDVAATATAETIGDLADGTAYSFSISAVNSAGTAGASGSASATTKPAPVPDAGPQSAPSHNADGAADNNTCSVTYTWNPDGNADHFTYYFTGNAQGIAGGDVSGGQAFVTVQAECGTGAPDGQIHVYGVSRANKPGTEGVAGAYWGGAPGHVFGLVHSGDSTQQCLDWQSAWFRGGENPRYELGRQHTNGVIDDLGPRDNTPDHHYCHAGTLPIVIMAITNYAPGPWTG